MTKSGKRRAFYIGIWLDLVAWFGFFFGQDFPSFAPPLASWLSARPKCLEKVSNDTLQSNIGYLPVYPWIHCEVSLDVVFS